jgi:hypothetical protein
MQLPLRLGIVEFVQRETHAPDRKQLVLAAASGTVHALILAPIDSAVESTGRRKRFVPVVSHLEDNPVHGHDELAADQNLRFRSCFYEARLEGRAK